MILLLSLAFTCLTGTDCRAAAGYDACLQAEKNLRAEEAEQCSGMSYIFNPSACFNTRKALAPYSAGKCREIAAGEGLIVKPAESARPAAVMPPPKSAAAVVAEPSVNEPLPKIHPAEAAVPATEIEQLRSEVAALRAELGRLKEEISGLKCQQK
jgi:hypothetical protein